MLFWIKKHQDHFFQLEITTIKGKKSFPPKFFFKVLRIWWCTGSYKYYMLNYPLWRTRSRPHLRLWEIVGIWKINILNWMLRSTRWKISRQPNNAALHERLRGAGAFSKQWPPVHVDLTDISWKSYIWGWNTLWTNGAFFHLLVL